MVKFTAAFAVWVLFCVAITLVCSAVLSFIEWDLRWSFDTPDGRLLLSILYTAMAFAVAAVWDEVPA